MDAVSILSHHKFRIKIPKLEFSAGKVPTASVSFQDVVIERWILVIVFWRFCLPSLFLVTFHFAHFFDWSLQDLTSCLSIRYFSICTSPSFLRRHSFHVGPILNSAWAIPQGISLSLYGSGAHAFEFVYVFNSAPIGAVESLKGGH